MFILVALNYHLNFKVLLKLIVYKRDNVCFFFIMKFVNEVPNHMHCINKFNLQNTKDVFKQIMYFQLLHVSVKFRY